MKSLKVKHFIDDVLGLSLIQPSVNDSIRINYWLASFLWHNYSGVYRLDALEESLVSRLQFSPTSDDFGEKDELHIITEVYSGGGHTPLMKLLLSESLSKPDVLVLQGNDKSTYSNVLNLDSTRINIIDESNIQNKIYKVASFILSYQKLYLHIHPNDLVAAIALRLAKKHNPTIKIYFINHADHAFSVAVGVADYIFEISANGWDLRSQKSTIDKSTFIGLPIHGDSSCMHEISRNPNLMITGGASHKFKPLKSKSLPRILDSVLRDNCSLRLLVIGAKWHDWWWWWLMIKYPKRAQRISFLSKENYSAILREASIYIDSYPIGGGTAFPEALMSGLNVFGLKDGTFGSTYADILRSGSERDFKLDIQRFLKGDSLFLENQEKVRSQCLAFHGVKDVMERIKYTENTSKLVPPPAFFENNIPIRYYEISWRNQSAVNLPKFLKFLDVNQSISIIKIYYKIFGFLNFSVFCYLIRLFFIKTVFRRMA